MRKKPIIFSTLMVQAILDGRKTQTRRIIPEKIIDDYYDYDDWCNAVIPRNLPCTREYEHSFFKNRARYQPGDVLWVREKTYGTPNGTDNQDLCYATHCPCGFSDEEHAQVKGWRSPRFMPKEAARIFLLVKGVRVEQVQDITDADILAEGFECREDFIVLWNILNEKRGHGWNKNDWVYAYTFEKISREEAERLEGLKC